MKFTEKSATTPLEILCNDHYAGMPIMVPSAGVIPNPESKKIVKAGSIYPSNDEAAIGVILHDTDVTNGDAPGTIIIHGFIDSAKLVKNGIVVGGGAAEALKLIKFIN